MNYLNALKTGKDKLQQADIADAATDAELLLMHVCGTERSSRFSHPEYELTEKEECLYQELISKRSSHIPLQGLL